MELAPSGVQLTFEVTYPTSRLPVAMSVYDTTGDTPILVQGPTAMLNVSDTNTYIGNFTAQDNSTYLILKAVYTDDSFEYFNNDYSQGSETIVTSDSGGGGSSTSLCPLVGYIMPFNTVVGFIEPDNTAIGIIEC